MSRSMYLFICVVFIGGCAGSLTDKQKQRAEDSTQYEIVWHSDRGNPYQDGFRIYIDPNYVTKHNLSLKHIIRHEEGHLEGLGHCSSRNCVMYYVHPWFGTRNFCDKCRKRIRPTTKDWLDEVIR